jgi:pimeloyl-ACP methyl ester carboxylesterase
MKPYTLLSNRPGHMIEHEVITPDGRALRVAERGVPDGLPVLVHHGTPGSRLMFDPDVGQAQQQGIRLISYDRPGYGGSDRLRGRAIGDCAADVRTIAAALGINRLAVWGISGGGPHALACAALLPDLVPAVAVLASPAPWGADGLDYFDGMGELNIDDTRLQLEDKPAARAKVVAERDEMLRVNAEQFAEMMRTLLGPADQAALTGELANFVIAEAHAGLAPGVDGWWDDGEAELAHWGFALDAIRTPVLLWHGRQDRFVPFSHAEWLAAHIPGVEAHFSEDDGHLTLTTNHLEEINVWLLDRL